MTGEWGSLRRGPMARLRRSGFTQPLPAASASELSSMLDRIDYLALLVTQLPNQELTPKQRDLLRVLARELLRRVNR